MLSGTREAWGTLAWQAAELSHATIQGFLGGPLLILLTGMSASESEPPKRDLDESHTCDA